MNQNLPDGPSLAVPRSLLKGPSKVKKMGCSNLRGMFFFQPLAQG